MRPSPTYKSCDTCRRKKVRCAPNESAADGSPCVACVKAGEDCTFNIGYKKPGRPSGVRGETTAHSSRSRSRSPSPWRRQSSRETTSMPNRAAPANTQPLAGVSILTAGSGLPDAAARVPDDAAPAPDAVSFDLDPPSISPLFTFLTDDGQTESPRSLLAGPSFPLGSLPASTPAIIHPATLVPTASTAPRAPETAALPTSPISPNTQIEDVASWDVIMFFLKLYLQYMHSLFPVVHKPSFFEMVAMRADQTDRNLRALMLALVAYTIGQVPLNRMQPMYSRATLERLQRRCHRASLVMLDRSYAEPTLVHVGVLMANYFCCQSRGQVHRALALLAEACQLTYLLRMHEDKDQPNIVDRELCRRIFWHVYAVDITEACAGNMVHLNDFEGLPSLPLVVDDELITPRGAFEQASGTVSYMAGFNGCVQLFPLLAQVIVRSKRLAIRQRQGRLLSPEEVEGELSWEADLRATLDGMIAALPPQLRAEWIDNGDAESSYDAILGMQRANIFVTESSLRICLLDYISEIVPSEEIAAARSSLAHRAYEALSSFPLDHLAANGESIRGKIFRIVMALLKTPDMDTAWIDMVHNWWGLFSRVNFVQLGPPSILLDSESE
ncbi:hypothetical protein CcaverHIS002_0609300 [Cutaneotrichosporon cavernicola]|uniref:Zn(2)-C6 fungal-type domain-containing protein n=1 Tax=Cutaneotrichosporon cavernicola TaxID=279322 RepID=A0AA48L9K0_9TREE|nr:uncharacterized protein CcaverHIS019_0608760 [Cutaneotrichosporon cavernicola]BEI86643.1 hypothetical protein CcaverHIS002_0609300 [Cutaneotrichosporon cavernicola]BEI94417.1 hypothetical protein CcaverHIS019_0608760 [Cutaneotrichosporon cavernicola]BEJ02194.1 hypothetical protein CcaverHIS631_0608760 [Cutaneotrichosporon cavernicola]BEJ09955.1 hypothetical protein CcaverHIS641_0608700 [Cutaneotrichosporon cavernicola]